MFWKVFTNYSFSSLISYYFISIMGKATRNQRKRIAKQNKKVSPKKLLSTFSQEELLKKAQDEINTFQYKEAQIYCQEAVKRDPDDLRALEVSASLCIETENLEGAKHCFGRAITLAPENGFTKYLSMGQLLEGKDSLQCYLKGIEILNQTIEESSKEERVLKTKLESKLENGEENSENEVPLETKKENASDSLIRKLSNAHCATAELYMSDLCEEAAAEAESLANIKKAINADPTNPEAYQHFANFLLIKQEFEEAKENIKKSISLWLRKYQEIEDGEACAGTFDPVDICPLTQSTRFQTARILIEVEEYESAADVLEGLLGEDDEVVYTWYLLGWNHYLQGDDHKLEAKQHFVNALELHNLCPSSDDGIIEHMKELLEELKNVEGNSEGDNIEDLESEIDEMEVS